MYSVELHHSNQCFYLMKTPFTRITISRCPWYMHTKRLSPSNIFLTILICFLAHVVFTLSRSPSHRLCWPPFSGFSLSLSTPCSALGDSSTETFTPKCVASTSSPMLRCSPPHHDRSTGRVLGGGYILLPLNNCDNGCMNPMIASSCSSVKSGARQHSCALIYLRLCPYSQPSPSHRYAASNM